MTQPAAKQDAQPTPGPWTVNEIGIWAERHGYVAHIGCSGPNPDRNARQRANAHLIAAAPDTAAERDRLVTANAELAAVLCVAENTHEYITPVGTTNCRFCDNCMDHEGTFVNMHAEDCFVLQARAVIALAKQEPTP